MSVLGIDFGTTNSSVAIFPPVSLIALKNEPDWPELLGPWKFQSPYECLLPSKVLLQPDKVPLVAGEIDHLVTIPPNGKFLQNFKSFLDERHLRRVTYRIRDEMDISAPPDAVTGGQVFRVVVEHLVTADCTKGELLAAATAVLRQLLTQDAVRRNWSEVEHIAVGVPAAYGLVARQRLLEAFFRTGVFRSRQHVVRMVSFVPEPVAISLGAPAKPAEFDPLADPDLNPAPPATGVSTGELQQVLIFDFGGGTLDLALVRARLDPFGRVLPIDVLAVGAPEADLGGRHFDEAILAHLVGRNGRPDLHESRLRQLVEQIKIDLSTTAVTSPQWGVQKLDVSRTEISQAVSPLIDKAFEAVDKFLHVNGILRKSINYVLPAGGMSLMPAVFDRLVGVFGEERVIRWGPGVISDDRATQRILAATSIGAAKWAHESRGGLNTQLDLSRLTDLSVWDFDENVTPYQRLRAVTLAGSEGDSLSRVGAEDVCIRRASDGPGSGTVVVVFRQGANDLPLQWTGASSGLDDCAPGQRARVSLELHPGKVWPDVTVKFLPTGRTVKLPNLDELSERELEHFLQREVVAVGRSDDSRVVCWDPIQVAVDSVLVRRNLSHSYKRVVHDARHIHTVQSDVRILWPRHIRAHAVMLAHGMSHSGWETFGPDELEVA